MRRHHEVHDWPLLRGLTIRYWSDSAKSRRGHKRKFEPGVQIPR